MTGRARNGARGRWNRDEKVGPAGEKGGGDEWHLNGDVLYAELHRQNDGNWKAVSSSGDWKDKSC